MAGVWVASLVVISAFLFWAAVCAAAFLFLAGISARKHKMAVGGILLAVFVFGFWRFDVAWLGAQNNELAKLSLKNTSGEFLAVVASDPVQKSASQQITVQPQGTPGKILITAKAYPQYQYGDLLKISGTLQKPEPFNGFDYRNFLAKDGIYSVMLFPEIELVGEGKGNFIIARLYDAKHLLEISVEQSLPSPQDNLLIAILLGDQEKLSGCSQKEIQAASESGGQCAKLKEYFNISGLRHLAAVSGEHITIMSSVFMAFLLGIGFWRGQAFWLVIIFIWLFIAMIGLPASAVRAGIMGSLMLLAQKIGRPAEAGRVVAIAATFMVLLNPMILRFDLGFQFSFLAVLGMAYLAKPIEALLNFVPKFWKIDLRGTVAATLSAAIFTIPLQIYNFGYMPVYSLCANILAAPVVPFITICGFVLAVAGAVWQWLAWILMFPMWLALSYLLFVAKFFFGLPYSSAELKINFIWLAVSYIVLAIIVWRVKEKEKLNFLNPR